MTQFDEKGGEETSTDSRRARMSDITRLTAQVVDLANKVDLCMEATKAAGERPMTKAAFYGQFFCMATLGGKKAQHLRAECDRAYAYYMDAMSGAPRAPLGGTPMSPEQAVAIEAQIMAQAGV